MLTGVQVIAGLGFFLNSIGLGDCEDSDSLLQQAQYSFKVPGGIVQ